MIDETFVREIRKMACLYYPEDGRDVKIYEVDGRQYSDAVLTPIQLPSPTPLEVDTLTAIKDYIERDPDGLLGNVVILVGGPSEVNVLSPIIGPFKQRYRHMFAKVPRNSFRFGEFQNVENFIIALQSLFVQDDTTENILKIVGNITDGIVKAFKDDGVTQQITVRAGVTKVADIPVPNPVILRPYRTFMEIAQPASRFLLRMRSGEHAPTCALFEADGGAWALKAVTDIKEWLIFALPKGTIVLA